jgi:predicted AAA+ superfamily ATPase
MQLDRLFAFQANVLKPVNRTFTRFLFDDIRWKQRMLGIRGLRGTGKTTMLLQYLKYNLREQGLYVSADHPWFYDNPLFDLAEVYDKEGGRTLLIDEIHKYPNWSRELKNIYDGYPSLQVIFTASSALDLQRGEADLSRRVISYELPGLSFREYLNFTRGGSLKKVSLQQLLTDANESIRQIPASWKVLPLFREYLKVGYFPFSKTEEAGDFMVKLNQVINTVLESDLAGIEGYTAGNIIQIKKLLGVIAESVPFTPNISSLAGKLKMGRDTVNRFLVHLERARVLNLMTQVSKGVAVLQKPDKIYLENPNLSYMLKDQPDKGSLRETFFLNQLRNAGHQVALAKQGDFLLNSKWTIEVGGKSKGDAQIRHIQQAFLALDDIEKAYLNRIPLWAFGFLY